jgi:hypothetical protein
MCLEGIGSNIMKKVSKNLGEVNEENSENLSKVSRCLRHDLRSASLKGFRYSLWSVNCAALHSLSCNRLMFLGKLHFFYYETAAQCVMRRRPPSADRLTSMRPGLRNSHFWQ